MYSGIGLSIKMAPFTYKQSRREIKRVLAVHIMMMMLMMIMKVPSILTLTYFLKVPHLCLS